MAITSPLRVGVIGLGAGSVHARAYSGHPQAELVALAGQEAERLAHLGAELEVPRLVTDWQQVVAMEDIDAVSIATPNALHHPIAIAALDSGKHVFCEKPLAVSTHQAREMVTAAQRNNRVLDVAFNHRRRADVQWAKTYVDTGALGRIYHVRAAWRRRAGIPGLTSWFTSKELAGGGALIDLGPHVLDSVLYLLGEPKVIAVSAVMHGDLGAAGYGAMEGAASTGNSSSFSVEDLAVALVRLEGGASIALEISWAGHAADDEDIAIELLGVDAGLRLFVPRYAGRNTLSVYKDSGGAHTVEYPDVVVPGGEHALVIGDFIAAVLSGDWSAHTGLTAQRRTEVLEACYESATRRQEVTL